MGLDCTAAALAATVEAMFDRHRRVRGVLIALLFLPTAGAVRAGTVALWLFDEPVDSYPSTILNDAGPGGHVLALGRGGAIVPGRFGNALASRPAPLPRFEMRGATTLPPPNAGKT